MSRQSEAAARIAERRSYSGGLLTPPCDARLVSPRNDGSGCWIASEPRPWIEPVPLAYRVGPDDDETIEEFAARWAPELARIAARNARRVREFKQHHPDWSQIDGQDQSGNLSQDGDDRP